VGWMSICLSRTAARAMAGVICVGVLAFVVMGIELVFRVLL
jgi:hypothetical protein